MAQATPEEFVKRIAAGFGIGWTGEPDFWRGGAEAGAALVRERDAAVRRAAEEDFNRRLASITSELAGDYERQGEADRAQARRAALEEAAKFCAGFDADRNDGEWTGYDTDTGSYCIPSALVRVIANRIRSLAAEPPK